MTRWLACGTLLGMLACGQQPEPTDTLRLALINDPILNPVLANELGSVLIDKVLFPGLVRPGDSLEAAPDLAASWEISADGRVYTFHLRPNAEWHDGTRVSAADVKFTFDQILDPKSGTLLWSDFSSIDSVVVLDSLTPRFYLREPLAPLLTLLGHNAGIVPAHAFDRRRRLIDQTEFNRVKPIGAGPFRIAENVPGSHLTLEANPRYFGAPPKLRRIVFRIVPDINTQVAELRAGELDLVTLEPANLRGVEGEPGLTIEQVAVPQHYFVGFNQGVARFKPAAVRRALTLAVNRQAIIDGVLRGYGDYPQGTIPIVLRDFYDSTLPRIPFDTAEALRLFRREGWNRGSDGLLVNASGERFTATLLLDKGNPSREQTAVAVQQDLRRIGVDLQIRTMEFAAMVRDWIQTRRYEAYLIWWNTPLDPDQYSYYGSGQANNDVQYQSARADSLLRLGRATLDRGRRSEIYRALQAVEADDPPALLLYYPREIRVRRSVLGGLPSLGIRDALRYSERLELSPSPAR